MNMEIWKDITGYEGMYQISNLGEVKSFLCFRFGKYVKRTHPRILKNQISKTGYYVIMLSSNGNNKTYKVHRLVALSFIPNHENKPQINHIDGDRLNNDISNLEWTTQKENVRHAFKTGLIPKSLGEKTSGCKINSKIALDIYNSKIFYKDLMKEYNVSSCTIYSIRSGRTWGHITNHNERRNRSTV